jgi:ATP-dependent DNA helicase RecQ
LRGAIAAAQKQPAYVIFPDRTLIEMAKRRLRSLDELASIHGVGVVKLEKYGRAFLAVIRSLATPEPPEADAQPARSVSGGVKCHRNPRKEHSA